MKRVLMLFLIVFFFSGCSEGDVALKQAVSLRETLLQSDGCTFETVITADYGEALYTFTMSCQADSQGNLTFSVIEPQTIAGISGRISDDGGELTFDDQVLAFALLADDQLTPVSAPWLFIKTLRSGYLRACDPADAGMRIIIDDSYAEDALQLDIWVDDNNIPVSSEILWKGRRILSLEIKNFNYV